MHNIIIIEYFMYFLYFFLKKHHIIIVFIIIIIIHEYFSFLNLPRSNFFFICKIRAINSILSTIYNTNVHDNITKNELINIL